MGKLASFTVALIHLRLKLLARRSNLEKARKLVRDAVMRGAKVAVLPAFVNTGAFFLHYPQSRSKVITRNYAEHIPGATTEYFSMVAIENSAYIVLGPIVERAGPRLFLSTVVIAPNGAILAKYRKISLNHIDTSLGISSGRQTIIMNELKRPIGILSEDDLYYPEIARSLILNGATALITSLRPGEDPKRVKLLLQTRSIENNVPILAVGGMLETVDRAFEIPTIVIDPQNGIVEELEEPKDTFVLVEVLEKPTNLKDIIDAGLRSKELSKLYCKAAKESLVENLAGQLGGEQR